MTFAYRAAEPSGRVVRGHVVAASRDAAASSLTEKGLWPVELHVRAHDHTLDPRRRGLSAAHLGLGLRILADLLAAGLTVRRALAAFEELAPAAWRAALPAIRESVRQGRSLGAALGDAPVTIPREIVGIIEAGEAGSGLAQAVRRAADLTEEAATVQAALAAALAYPIILAMTGMAALAVIVGVVLPRFALILADIGQSLPPLTRAVLAVGAVLQHSSAWLAVVAGLLVVAWRAAVATPRGRRVWHRLLLHTPLFGGVRRSAAASRFCTSLSALLESGVPVAAAMPHAARATGDAVLGNAVLAAREQVVHGDRPSRALAAHDAATTTVYRLIAAGETSGLLAQMLVHAARIERERAIGRTRAIIRLLEPSLILVFGGLVAVVAAALLQALYSMRPSV